MFGNSNSVRKLIRFLFLAMVAGLPCWTASVTAAEETDAEVLAGFLAHVAELEIAGEQTSKVEQLCQEFSDSVADAITESLIVLNPAYGSAIEAADESSATIAAPKFDAFLSSTDKYLAADASFYLARGYMNEERFEDAISLLAEVQDKFSDYSVHVGQAQFYTGIAQAGLLKYEDAVETLNDFLQFYPTAPERLRVAAWRQIQQLRSIESGKMEDVYQRMDYSRRKLSLKQPGEQTQVEQDKIVKMLAKLIKEQEKKEASQSQQKPKDQKNTQQQQQQQQQQSKSKQQSKSQTGGTSNNPNGKVVNKAYNDGPASPWSRLRDRSRDPANNAIKDKLPARYRDIVERYYEAANGDAKK